MAIDTLGANALSSNSVTSAKIAADAITTAKIANDAVTGAKIPADAVVAADIADGSITTAKLAADAVTTAKLAADAVTTTKIATNAIRDEMPTGSVLQTLQGSKTDTSSISSTSFTNIGLSVTITPKATSSKILVKVILFGYAGHYVGKSRVLREFTGNSTELGRAASASLRPAEALPFSSPPDTDGSMMEVSTEILDSPSTTNAITYSIQTACRADGTEATYINRSEVDRNTTSYDPRTVSYITVMEIAG